MPDYVDFSHGRSPVTTRANADTSSSGAQYLTDLLDVEVASQQDANVLQYNSSASEWQNITPLRKNIATVPYAASVTPNADTTNIVSIGQLTGDITINDPSGTPEDGQELEFRFLLDASSRTITWDTGYVFGTVPASTDIPTAANSKFEIKFRYHNGDSKWRCIAIAKGF